MEPLEMITIVGSILGSSLMTIAVLLRQMNHLETKLTAKIDNLDAKFTKEFRRVAKEFKRVRRDIFGLGERIARLEGRLEVPGGHRRDRANNQPSAGAPSPDAPTPADTSDDPPGTQHLQAS